MLKTYTNIKAFALLFLLVSGILVTACNDDDEPSSLVQLDSFGPSPALRGGDLRFIGTNLDKVSAIVLPGNVEVTSFKTKTPTLLVIEVPNETVDGIVILKTPGGDIETKTRLGISEPITITSITPAEVRPGEVVTIKGTYLNLIEEVVFSNNQSVTEFESHSQTTIEVLVPTAAQTGNVILSNGEEEPILVESEEELVVTLPTITAISRNPVKAGDELVISGTDLDLTTAVVFGGGSRVENGDFEITEDGDLVLNVPDDAKDGEIVVIAPSFVENAFNEELMLVSPEIATIAPNPGKTGGNITVTGTDLDLITSVSFVGKSEEDEEGEVTIGQTDGEILDGGTATEITVSVPADATEGIVTFHTAADKSVASADVLELVEPTITSFTPTTVKTVDEPSITITGTNLDIVEKVVFAGDWEAVVTDATEASITIDVPPGSLSGPITLVTTNGTEVESSQSLTIVPNIPHITDIPLDIFIGEMLTIEGTNMNVFADLIFPGNVKATMFGVKNSSLIEVFVPMGTQPGVGKIQFVTKGNEVTESSEIDFKKAGIDPVADESLVFFDFDGKGSWWGDTGEVENDETLSLDGSNYFRVNASLSGWTGFFWRNSKDNFPADEIGTDVADYVLKFDINVIEPITGGEFVWRFVGGDSGDFTSSWAPWEESGSYSTPGWTTITIPLTEFKDGSTVLSDLSTIDADFGVAFNNGDSDVNAAIDNVRFELVE